MNSFGVTGCVARWLQLLLLWSEGLNRPESTGSCLAWLLGASLLLPMCLAAEFSIAKLRVAAALLSAGLLALGWLEGAGIGMAVGGK